MFNSFCPPLVFLFPLQQFVFEPHIYSLLFFLPHQIYPCLYFQELSWRVCTVVLSLILYKDADSSHQLAICCISPCIPLVLPPMQPSHMGEECHKRLCSECIVLFKAFQQKSWNPYAAGVLEVLSPPRWPPWFSAFSHLLVCIHPHVVSYTWIVKFSGTLSFLWALHNS